MDLKEKQFTLCLMAAILWTTDFEEDIDATPEDQRHIRINEAFAIYDAIQKRLILEDIPKPSGDMSTL